MLSFIKYKFIKVAQFIKAKQILSEVMGHKKVSMNPSMQRSTKQFYWKICCLVVYHREKAQLKCLNCFTKPFWFCKSETAFWLKKISVLNKSKHCLLLVHSEVRRRSFKFRGGKISKKESRTMQLKALLGNNASWWS